MRYVWSVQPCLLDARAAGHVLHGGGEVLLEVDTPAKRQPPND